MIQMKKHIQTVHKSKPKRASERLSVFTPTPKPSKRSKIIKIKENKNEINHDGSIFLMHEDTDNDMEVNLEEKTAPQVDKIVETEVEMEGLVSCSQCD